MSRRGMSLIEVLAATVLLAMTAAACMPVLVAASSSLHAEEDDAAVGVDELGLFVDEVLAGPERFGVSLDDFRAGETITVPWVDAPHRAPIRAIPYASTEDDERNIWVVFSCTRSANRVIAVARWLAPSIQPEDTQ